MAAKDFFKDLISLDIETTGIDAVQDKPWSVGFAGRKSGQEFFISYLGESVQQADYLQHMMQRSPVFAQEQFQRGSLTPFLDSVKNNQAVSPTEAAQRVGGQVSRAKAVLIQNHNFENQMLAQMFQETGVDKPEMRFSTKMEGFTEDGRFLYTPPAATSKRTEAASLYDRFLSTKDQSLRFQAEEAYMQLGDVYKSEYMQPTRQGAFVIDLMDITKSTYAAASRAGLIDPEYMNIGTSVNFLSRNLLLLGEEKHTALDDATRQIQIFDRLNDLRSKMSEGTMNVDDYSTWERIRRAQPVEAHEQFTKALKNTLEEIHNSGYTRVLNKAPTPNYNDPITVYGKTKQGSVEEHQLLRKNYTKALTTSDWRVGFASVYERYSRIGRIDATGKNYKDSELYKGLESRANNADRIKYMEQFTKNNGGMKVTGWKSRNVFQKLADLSFKQKTFGTIATLAAATYAVNSATANDKPPPPKKPIRDPNPYHGTGFYNFENSQGHHKL